MKVLTQELEPASLKDYLSVVKIIMLDGNVNSKENKEAEEVKDLFPDIQE